MVSAILTYHSLDASGSVISIRPSVFRQHIEALHRTGAPVVPLNRVRHTPGAVAITFDDGFKNFLDHAAPLLQQYRYPATVFAVSGYCGGYNQWPSQPAGAIPRLELMNWSDLREIAAQGVELGAHTASHPFLSRMSEQDAAAELDSSKKEIEDRTGRTVSTLAYPYGDSSVAVRRLAAERFDLACGADLRFVTARSVSSNLPRLDAYYFHDPGRLEKLTSAPVRSYLAVRRVMRGIRAAVNSYSWERGTSR
jgi:peptidoglycan/xylan/chitin deacetylase (PgdA/CDA1 family)